MLKTMQAGRQAGASRHHWLHMAFYELELGLTCGAGLHASCTRAWKRPSTTDGHPLETVASAVNMSKINGSFPVAAAAATAADMPPDADTAASTACQWAAHMPCMRRLQQVGKQGRNGKHACKKRGSTAR